MAKRILLDADGLVEQARVREPGPFRTGGYEVLPPGVYLIKESKPDFTNREFLSLTSAGRPGLVITRRHPHRVKRERGFSDSRVIWLSRTVGPDNHDPTDLDSLAKLISRFIDENRSVVVILLDGLDYLIVNNGPYETLLFVERLNEFMMHRKAIVLMPVSPDTLNQRELAQVARRFPSPFVSVLQPPLGEGGRKFVERVAPGILVIPTRRGLVSECERLRKLLSMPVDIDKTGRSVEKKIREARRGRIPFIVLVEGGEAQSMVVHVILWTGKETWMTLEALRAAFKEWHLNG